MNSHSELSDELFEEQFQNCQLNPALTNHEAHLRIAWIHITKMVSIKQLKTFQTNFSHFSVSLCAINKLNKAIGWQLKPSTLTI